MHLRKLSLVNFKNYEEVSLEFDSRINLLVGRNGSGKTNLLDSIYYLAFTKSAFSATDVQCIRTGESFFMLKGIFQKAEGEAEIVASVQTGQKKVFRENQMDCDKLSDHIGKYPVVLIAPDDTDLIREGSELRRKFFDGILAQIDHRYLDALMRYTHVLRQRNALLKMSAESGKAVDNVALDTYDAQLIKLGEYIFRQRSAFMSEFLLVFASFFAQLVEEPENPGIRYESALNDTTFEEGVRLSRGRDLVAQRTTFGIHRDDFVFSLQDSELRKSGSQGQQKSFVIALKLAQYEIIRIHKGFKPILLLDDIFDKLDDFRIRRLMELIEPRLGQIFVTDARPQRTEELIREGNVSASRFLVERGRINLAP